MQGRRREGPAGRAEIYDLLTKEAEAVRPGSQGLFFLPYLSGERTPHADPDARGAMIGITLAHTRGHLIRAVMEGVTYSMRDSLEIIEGLGVPVRQIRASGGGSRSPLWRQIQADVFGRKVVTINSEEGAAYGVALLAAVGRGLQNIQEACAATIRVVKQTESNRQARIDTTGHSRSSNSFTARSKRISSRLPCWRSEIDWDLGLGSWVLGLGTVATMEK